MLLLTSSLILFQWLVYTTRYLPFLKNANLSGKENSVLSRFCTCFWDTAPPSTSFSKYSTFCTLTSLNRWVRWDLPRNCYSPFNTSRGNWVLLSHSRRMCLTTPFSCRAENTFVSAIDVICHFSPASTHTRPFLISLLWMFINFSPQYLSVLGSGGSLNVDGCPPL